MKFIIINENFYIVSHKARFIHYGKGNIFSSIRNQTDSWDITLPPFDAVVRLKVKYQF